MKRMKGAIGLLVTLCVTHVATAEWMPINGGNDFEYNGLIFSDIQISSTGFGAAIIPTGDQITVEGRTLGDYDGLRFNAHPSWYVGAGEVALSTISYTVSVAPGSGLLITGNKLTVGPTIGSTAAITMQQTVYDSNGAPLSSMQILRTEGLGDSYHSGMISSEGVSQLLVVKDLTLFGAADEALLCNVGDYYSVIPEPASMGMLGAGSIFSLILRRKSRKRRPAAKRDFDSVVLSDADMDAADLFEEASMGYIYTGRERLKSPIF